MVRMSYVCVVVLGVERRVIKPCLFEGKTCTKANCLCKRCMKIHPAYQNALTIKLHCVRWEKPTGLPWKCSDCGKLWEVTLPLVTLACVCAVQSLGLQMGGVGRGLSQTPASPCVLLSCAILSALWCCFGTVCPQTAPVAPVACNHT